MLDIVLIGAVAVLVIGHFTKKKADYRLSPSALKPDKEKPPVDQNQIQPVEKIFSNVRVGEQEIIRETKLAYPLGMRTWRTNKDDGSTQYRVLAHPELMQLMEKRLEELRTQQDKFNELLKQ